MLPVTDRSRYLDGIGFCQMYRYLKYHAGPQGLGLSPAVPAKAPTIGLAYHDALARCIKHLYAVHAEREQPTQWHGFLIENTSKFRALIWQALVLHNRCPSAPDWVVLDAEAQALVKAMAWGWLRTVAFQVLRDYELVKIEGEELLALGCTCAGASMANNTRRETGKSVHQADCQATILQSRPDLLLRNRKTKHLEIHDHKTESTIGDRDKYIRSYQDDVQFTLGASAVEARMGERVTHYVVQAVVKGQDKARYVKETKKFEGPSMIQSDLLYGSSTSAVGHPILAPVGKWYEKLPTWKPEVVERYGWEGKSGLQPMEWWVLEQLPQSVLNEMYLWVGPYEVPRWMAAEALRDIEAFEREWQGKLWDLWQTVGEAMDGPAPVEDAWMEITKLFPRAWQNCQSRFGAPCEFYGICHGQVLLVDAPRIYKPREPHHEYERQGFAEAAKAQA